MHFNKKKQTGDFIAARKSIFRHFTWISKHWDFETFFFPRKFATEMGRWVLYGDTVATIKSFFPWFSSFFEFSQNMLTAEGAAEQSCQFLVGSKDVLFQQGSA